MSCQFCALMRLIDSSYIIKLFRDFVFHSIGPTGTPILDLSHVITNLNKASLTIRTRETILIYWQLDAGLDERIMLVSRDDRSCLVVTYREIKNCIDSAYK